MKIALDFDLTFTADPEFWFSFLDLAHSMNIEVFIVTSREEKYDRCELLDIIENQIDVYYTSGVAKRWWMEHFAKPEHAYPDIWIDDKPESVSQNSSTPVEALIKWRASGENKKKAIAV